MPNPLNLNRNTIDPVVVGCTGTGTTTSSVFQKKFEVTGAPGILQLGLVNVVGSFSALQFNVEYTANFASPNWEVIGVWTPLTSGVGLFGISEAGFYRLNCADFTGGTSVDVYATIGLPAGSVTAGGGTAGHVIVDSGTISATQGTTPWQVSANGTANSSLNPIYVNVVNSSGSTVTGTLTNNNAAPAATNNLGVLPAVANAAHPTWTEGYQVLLSTDLNGQQRVTDAAAEASLATLAGTVSGGTVVVSGTVSATQGTSPWVISFTAPQHVIVDSGSVGITGTVSVTQGTSPWVVSLASTTITGTVAVTQSTSPWVVSGTVSANCTQTTSPWVVSLASTTITGTVAVTQSTSPWVTAGNLTNNNAAPGTANVGVLPGVANAVAPTWTEGDQVLESMDLQGRQRVIASQGTSPWVVSLASTTITGTVAVTQSTTPWQVSGNGTANSAANPIFVSTVEPGGSTGSIILNSPTDQFVVSGGDEHNAPHQILTDDIGRIILSDQSETKILNASGGAIIPVSVTGTPSVTILGTPSVTVTNPVTNVVVTSSASNPLNVASHPVVNNPNEPLVTSGLDEHGAPRQILTDDIGRPILSDQSETRCLGSDGSPFVKTQVSVPPSASNGVPGNIPVGNNGLSNTFAASWTSNTPQNTAALLVNNIPGLSSISVTLNTTSTFTGGVLTFQTSNDGSNWYSIAGVDPNTLTSVGPTYTLVASTFVIYMFTLPAPYFRIINSTAISGTGTLTIGYAVDTLPTVHAIAGTFTGASIVGGTFTVSSNGSTGSAVPASADYEGLNVGGTLRGWTGVNPSGTVYAGQVDIASIAGTTVTTAASGVQKVGIVGNAGAAMDAALGTAPTNALGASLFPVTSGGLSISFTNNLITSVTSVKSSAGQIYGWHIGNNTGIACFVQVFNVASGSVSLGSTAPTFVVFLPTGGATNVSYENGITMGTAISVAATTTATGSTTPGNGVVATFFYK